MLKNEIVAECCENLFCLAYLVNLYDVFLRRISLSTWSAEETYLVFPQLGKALIRKMEGVFKNPVHHGDYLAEFVSVMVRIPILF